MDVNEETDGGIYRGEGFDGKNSVKECAAAAAELLGNLDAHEAELEEPEEELGVELLVFVHAANERRNLVSGELPDGVTKESFIFA